MKKWKVFGYVLVVLTVLFVLNAIIRITHLPPTSDTARHLGGIIGSFILPIITCILAVVCFRRARNRS